VLDFKIYQCGQEEIGLMNERMKAWLGELIVDEDDLPVTQSCLVAGGKGTQSLFFLSNACF
jgi:hypothetical protein